MCLIGRQNNTVCEGDEGGPAIKERDGLMFLAGIVINEMPKTNQGLNGMRYFCGPENPEEGKAVPGKFVKISQDLFLDSLFLRCFSGALCGLKQKRGLFRAA